jgi:hypothetical protein
VKNILILTQKTTKVTTHSMLKCNKKTPLIIEECCQSNKKDISLHPQTALEPRNTLSKRLKICIIAQNTKNL